MKKIENIDVRKISETEKSELIKKYVSAGWEYGGTWDLSVHQWLTFIWSKEEAPPEM